MGQPAEQENTLPLQLRKSYPGYDSWNIKDLSQLKDETTASILNSFTRKDKDRIEYIPKSIIAQYGDAAPHKFALALLRLEVSKGNTEAFFNALIEGGVVGTYKLPLSTDLDLTGKTFIAHEGTQHAATPAAITNWDVVEKIGLIAAKRAAEKVSGKPPAPVTEFEVCIPATAMKAVVNSNVQINFPTSAARTPLCLDGSDELFYISGYLTAMGVSNSIGKITRNGIPDSILAEGSQVFDPNRPDMDVYRAWHGGFHQGETDSLTLPKVKATATALSK